MCVIGVGAYCRDRAMHAPATHELSNTRNISFIVPPLATTSSTPITPTPRGISSVIYMRPRRDCRLCSELFPAWEETHGSRRQASRTQHATSLCPPTAAATPRATWIVIPCPKSRLFQLAGAGTTQSDVASVPTLSIPLCAIDRPILTPQSKRNSDRSSRDECFAATMIERIGSE